MFCTRFQQNLDNLFRKGGHIFSDTSPSRLLIPFKIFQVRLSIIFLEFLTRTFDPFSQMIAPSLCLPDHFARSMMDGMGNFLTTSWRALRIPANISWLFKSPDRDHRVWNCIPGHYFLRYRKVRSGRGQHRQWPFIWADRSGIGSIRPYMSRRRKNRSRATRRMCHCRVNHSPF